MPASVNHLLMYITREINKVSTYLPQLTLDPLVEAPVREMDAFAHYMIREAKYIRNFLFVVGQTRQWQMAHYGSKDAYSMTGLKGACFYCVVVVVCSRLKDAHQQCITRPFLGACRSRENLGSACAPRLTRAFREQFNTCSSRPTARSTLTTTLRTRFCLKVSPLLCQDTVVFLSLKRRVGKHLGEQRSR